MPLEELVLELEYPLEEHVFRYIFRMYVNRQSYDSNVAVWRCGGVAVWRCGGVADRMVVDILLDVTLGMHFLHSQVSPAHSC